MFELRKAKLAKNNGIEVLYMETSSTKGPHEVDKKFSYPVHDDMKNAFQKLRIALVKFTQLDWPFRAIKADLLTSAEEVEAANVLREKLTDCYEALESKLKVNGFTISGEDSTRGIVVIGSFESHGKSIVVNSPNIRFNQTVLGIESELESAADDCIEEVRLYLHENKTGTPTQPELAFPDDDTEGAEKDNSHFQSASDDLPNFPEPKELPDLDNKTKVAPRKPAPKKAAPKKAVKKSAKPAKKAGKKK